MAGHQLRGRVFRLTLTPPRPCDQIRDGPSGSLASMTDAKELANRNKCRTNLNGLWSL
jgi:hypothetical protein